MSFRATLFNNAPMYTRLFVGNIPFYVTEQDLTDIFSTTGQVQSTQIVRDPKTKRAKGFGFVVMANDQEAKAAIEKYDGGEIDGRLISVHIAKAPIEGPGGGRSKRPFGRGGDTRRGKSRGSGGRSHGGPGERSRRPRPENSGPPPTITPKKVGA